MTPPAPRQLPSPADDRRHAGFRRWFPNLAARAGWRDGEAGPVAAFRHFKQVWASEIPVPVRILLLVSLGLAVGAGILATDRARACVLGAARVGWTCDTGMLIALITATMFGSALAGFLWSAKIGRA